MKSCGGTFKDIVKVTVFVVNSNNEKLKIIREIREIFFSATSPPAYTYLGVEKLYHKDVMFEIEAIAVIKE